MAVAFGADELQHAVWTGAPVIVATSNVTARSTQLQPGLYQMISDATCWFKQGTVAVNAAATDNYLPGNTPVLVNVTNATDNGYVAVILASGTGKLYIMQPV